TARKRVQVAAVRDPDNPRARAEADPEKWWEADTTEPLGYSALLAAAAPMPASRQAMLAQYFEPEEGQDDTKGPTAAHQAIAQLVKRGSIRVILTINFDRLTERALQEIGISPQVVRRPEQIKGMKPLAHSQVTVIKLHGDYTDLEQRNTVDELKTHHEELQQLLERVLDEYGLIVCGWSADGDKALVRAVEGTRSRPVPAVLVAVWPVQRRRPGPHRVGEPPPRRQVPKGGNPSRHPAGSCTRSYARRNPASEGSTLEDQVVLRFDLLVSGQMDVCTGMHAVLSQCQQMTGERDEALGVRLDSHLRSGHSHLDLEALVPCETQSSVGKAVGHVDHAIHRFINSVRAHHLSECERYPCRYTCRFSTTIILPGFFGFGSSRSKFMCGPTDERGGCGSGWARATAAVWERWLISWLRVLCCAPGADVAAHCSLPPYLTVPAGRPGPAV
ncbi:hypothetical protein C3492_41360, partial [Streptomyces sp. Ru62]|uniref:SIR2 family protein n=1 Tax=Streptomyces sp. Ru62 TaxID=2080745 RepID=UPI000D451F26